jgi:hypothetical protein
MRRFLLSASLLALCTGAHANTCVPLQAGATDQSVYLEFIDESTGAPTAGLVFNSSGIDLEYVRSGAAATDITEATQTAAGAHSDGGFVSVGHGRYRLDLPDAAVATGVPQVVVQGVITGYIMLPCVVALSPPANVVRFGGTDGTFTSGRPNVNASHLGGTSQTGRDIGASVLLSSGTGTGQVTLTSGRVNADVTHWGTTAVATARPLVDAVQISGDSGAADALENWMDGTAGAVPYTGITDRGTLQAVDGDSAQLRSAATFGDNILNGSTIVITSGTYAGLRGSITDYTGASDDAVVTWAGGVTPSGTPTYEVWGTAEGSGGGGGGDATAANQTQILADIAVVDGNVDTLLSRMGTPSNLGGGATVAANLADIEGQTDDIGAAGAGLTAADDAVMTRLGAPTGASISADIAAVKSDSAAILVDTGTTLDGKLDTIDTVADAIKVKTDQLTFGVTNTLNVNVEYMNAEQLCGTGDSGTPWAGCP